MNKVKDQLLGKAWHSEKQEQVQCDEATTDQWRFVALRPWDEAEDPHLDHTKLSRRLRWFLHRLGSAISDPGGRQR